MTLSHPSKPVIVVAVEGCRGPSDGYSAAWVSAMRRSWGRCLRASRKSAVTYSGGIGWGLMDALLEGVVSE